MEGLWNKISIDKIVRYGYSGFLILLFSLLLAPETRTFIDDKSAAIIIILVMCAGACFYVIYRYIIGILVLFPLMLLSHRLIEIFSKTISSPYGYLSTLGISYLNRRSAYELIRREYFKEEERKKYDFAHSEAHLVYLTGTISLLVTLLFKSNSFISDNWISFLIGSIAIILAAFGIDIQQHMIEYRNLIKKKLDLMQFLIDNNYNLSSKRNKVPTKK